MVNLNCILAPLQHILSGGRKCLHFHYLGAKSAPGIQKWLHFVPPFFEILNLNKITMKLEHKKWGQKAQE